MRKIYKYNYVLFSAVIITLILCLPILSIDTQAKNIQDTKQSTASKTNSSSKNSSAVEDDEIDKQLKAAGLVNLKELGENFVYEQRYATTNNFTGKKIYQSEKLYLTKESAEKLAKANQEFNKLGYRIKIWDAYRPVTVQYILYKAAPAGAKYFIASPYKEYKSVHNHAAAVDITLVHMDGSPVEMPTDFDNMNYDSDYRSSTKTKAASENRALLRQVMENNGYTGIECEWWHFNDSDAYKYPLVDIVF